MGVVVNFRNCQPDCAGEIIHKVPGVVNHVPHAVVGVVVLCRHEGHGLRRVPVFRGEGNLDGDRAIWLALERDAAVVPVPHGQSDARFRRRSLAEMRA